MRKHGTPQSEKKGITNYGRILKATLN